MSSSDRRDLPRAARAIEDFLRAMGEEPSGELAGTGERVAEAWHEDLLAGVGRDPAEILRQGAIELGEGDHGLVGIRGVSVTSMCPHHLLPSHGRASVAFAPGRAAAGLGVLAQAVQLAARRLVLQETLGADIADAIVRGLGARGALCRLELVHTCLVSRGEREAGAWVDTLALRGSFAEGGADRATALAWVSAGGPPPGDLRR